MPGSKDSRRIRRAAPVSDRSEQLRELFRREDFKVGPGGEKSRDLGRRDANLHDLGVGSTQGPEDHRQHNPRQPFSASKAHRKSA
jgi:hypothetical protein